MRTKTPQRPERKDAGGGREVRSFALQIKAAGDDGTVEGYGSVFGVRDNYDDVIAKGAFIQSLKDHKAAGTMPAMLWQHDADKPIGVWTEMVEDEKGLRIKGQLAMETVKGKEAHALLKMGALNGLSIGFMSKEWAYDRDTEVAPSRPLTCGKSPGHLPRQRKGAGHECEVCRRTAGPKRC